MSEGWEIRWSNSRSRPYFYNASTQTSVWMRPEEIPESALEYMPGSDYLRAPPAQTQAPSSVRASHLLIKHRDSRRPASWKEDPITRSKEEALEKLKAFHEQLSQSSAADLPGNFARLAETESDCSSHSKGGDLGSFKRGQMQKPFEDASFGLPVGTMSGIVETDSGVHLILRTA